MAEARLNVRIPDDLDQELEIAIARRRAPSKQAAAIDALKAWLSRDSTDGSSTNTVGENTDPVVPLGPEGESGTWEEHRKAHEALEYILEQGPKGMAADILGNIKWFAFAAKVAKANDPTVGKLSEQNGERVAQIIAEFNAFEQENSDVRRAARAHAARKKPGEKEAV